MSLWNKIKSFFGKKESSRNCKGPCKHSLHIGINDYPGSANDLRGCVNDANSWEDLLKNNYGFNTTKLLDSKATRHNVVKEMEKIVSEATTGSTVVITFSGHGTNVKDVSGDEEDKRDEALCLYDELLIDDELRSILMKIASGVNLTFISDSCHSGTVTRSFLNTLYNEESPKPRYLPPEDDEEVFTVAPNSISKKIFIPQEGMSEVLLTGCNATEYSYDAHINGKFQGAMTATAIKILKNNSDCSYNEFYKILREELPSRQFPQTPQLEGSPNNLDRKVFM